MKNFQKWCFSSLKKKFMRKPPLGALDSHLFFVSVEYSTVVFRQLDLSMDMSQTKQNKKDVA